MKYENVTSDTKHYASDRECTLGGFETISSSSTLSVGQDIDNISLNMKGFEI